jgi:hypothetical protein
MRKLLVIVGALLALLTPLVAVAASNGQVNRELAAVRRATAKYHDVSVAIADGYMPAEACAALPGQGGMGYHYVNPQLASDLQSDLLQPEVLLYAPSDTGLKLVGVEYFQAAAGQPHPALLGQRFDGPMAGHEPGMPTHYDLHVWLWERNPSGMFAPWNPAVSC